MKSNPIFLALLLSVALSACAVHEGQSRHIQSPTLGSELIQLQKAYEDGAISEREYRETKRDLLDGKPDYRRGYFSEQPVDAGEREDKQ